MRGNENAPAPESQVFGETVKLYRRNTKGPGAAATIQAVFSQDRNQTATVNIEVAYWASDSKGPDWGNKITVQVSRAELPLLASTLAGFREAMSAKFHGPQKNIGYSLENNGRKLKVFKPGAAMEFQLSDDEHYWLLDLVLSRIQANRPTLTISDILNILRLSTKR